MAARSRTGALRRAASADECVAAIRFLLSDQSAHRTGQAINSTGGLVTG